MRPPPRAALAPRRPSGTTNTPRLTKTLPLPNPSAHKPGPKNHPQGYALLLLSVAGSAASTLYNEWALKSSPLPLLAQNVQLYAYGAAMNAALSYVAWLDSLLPAASAGAGALGAG